MKKYLLVVFCAFLLVLVTGCNKNQVKCSKTSTEGGVEIKADIIADLDADNKVTDATVVYTLPDKDTVEQYCSLFKLAESAENGITVDCSGKKITIKGYAKLLETEDEDVEEVDDEDETEEATKKILGITKEEFVKLMEEETYTCK